MIMGNKPAHATLNVAGWQGGSPAPLYPQDFRADIGAAEGEGHHWNLALEIVPPHVRRRSAKPRTRRAIPPVSARDVVGVEGAEPLVGPCRGHAERGPTGWAGSRTLRPSASPAGRPRKTSYPASTGTSSTRPSLASSPASRSPTSRATRATGDPSCPRCDDRTSLPRGPDSTLPVPLGDLSSSILRNPVARTIPEMRRESPDTASEPRSRLGAASQSARYSAQASMTSRLRSSRSERA